MKKAKKKHEHLNQIGLGTLPLTTTVSVADLVKKISTIVDFHGVKIYDYINFRNANCVRGSWPLKVI